MASSMYFNRLISFFRRGFNVTGLGLGDKVKELSAVVTVTIAADGTVAAFTIDTLSGNTRFDDAVRSAMQAKIGKEVPQPPEDRPDLKRSKISMTFTCPLSCN